MNPFLDRGGGHSRPKGTTYAKVGEIPTLGKQKDLGWSLGAGPGEPHFGWLLSGGLDCPPFALQPQQAWWPKRLKSSLAPGPGPYYHMWQPGSTDHQKLGLDHWYWQQEGGGNCHRAAAAEGRKSILGGLSSRHYCRGKVFLCCHREGHIDACEYSRDVLQKGPNDWIRNRTLDRAKGQVLVTVA